MALAVNTPPPVRIPSAMPPPVLAIDPVQAARAASLRYVSDGRPGIRRKRAGRHWSFAAPDGSIIRDAATIRRIKALAIPPAWTDVWISPAGNGHIQATGRDARGRKQYRYHARWHEVRDETKYGRMIAFAHALPGIRDRVDSDLARQGLPREKVLAAIVRLLETTLIRVGNEEYVRNNKSYGLTTMRNKHVDIDGSLLKFRFRGKSGKEHDVGIRDRRLARVVARLQDLPGEELFQFTDEAGDPQTIDSSDVNAYLRDISEQDFTAKDFRTWAGTVIAALALKEFEAFDSEAQAKKNVVRAIESVAQRLGNTPAVSRKCYVHPAIIDAYMDGVMAEMLQRRVAGELRASLQSLTPEEAAVLALLHHRLGQVSAEQMAG